MDLPPPWFCLPGSAHPSFPICSHPIYATVPSVPLPPSPPSVLARSFPSSDPLRLFYPDARRTPLGTGATPQTEASPNSGASAADL